MSNWISSNITLPNTKKIFFGARDSSLAIYTTTGTDLNLEALGVSAILNIKSGLGGTAIDSTGAINIGTSTASSVVIGSSGKTTTVAGDLSVNGTVKTINRTQIEIGENLLTLNAASGGSTTDIDGGLLIQSAPADIVLNSPPIGGEFSSSGAGQKPNQFGLASGSGDIITDANNIVNITTGLFTGQALRVKSVDFSNYIVTLDNNWTPVSLPGAESATVNGGGTITITGENMQPGSLTQGSIISLLFGGKPELFYVNATPTTDTAIEITFLYVYVGDSTVIPTGDSTSITIPVLKPGANISYNVYNNFYAGMIWNAGTQKFNFASTQLDPGYGSVVQMALLDIVAKNALFDSLSFTGTTPATYNTNDQKIENTSLTLAGGLGTTSNILAHTDGSFTGINAPVVDLTQSSTNSSANSVLSLSQNYTAGAFMTLVGSSNTTSGSLTAPGYSIVSDLNSSNTNINGAIAGYVRISVTDNNTGLGALTDGFYYLPIYSLA